LHEKKKKRRGKVRKPCKKGVILDLFLRSVFFHHRQEGKEGPGRREKGIAIRGRNGVPDSRRRIRGWRDSSLALRKGGKEVSLRWDVWRLQLMGNCATILREKKPTVHLTC